MCREKQSLSHSVRSRVVGGSRVEKQSGNGEFVKRRKMVRKEEIVKPGAMGRKTKTKKHDKHVWG